MDNPDRPVKGTSPRSILLQPHYIIGNARRVRRKYLKKEHLNVVYIELQINIQNAFFRIYAGTLWAFFRWPVKQTPFQFYPST